MISDSREEWSAAKARVELVMPENDGVMVGRNCMAARLASVVFCAASRVGAVHAQLELHVVRITQRQDGPVGPTLDLRSVRRGAGRAVGSMSP